MNKWIIVVATTLLAACSSSPKVDRLPDSADAREELSKLRSDMTEARKAQADVLAPNSWERALYYEKRAEDRLNRDGNKRNILGALAQSRAYLNQALAQGQEAQSVIPDVLQLREQAMSAHASEFARREWQEAEEEMKDYASDRENEEFGIADDKRAELRRAYGVAHVRALQNAHLGDARKAIQEAKKNDAVSLTPNVLKKAEQSLKNAEGFIAANRTDKAGIERAARQATADAAFLLRVTNEARGVSGSSTERQAILNDKVKQRNLALAGALDQQAFDQKYEEAREMFVPSEAEVYKQGDKLLIRMKGIEFKTGQAALPPASYGLVTKSGNVIKLFGEPQVRIEGHTDATGSKAINARLSQQRAQAVKEYLVSNSSLKPEQIEVVGEGDSRPLATNKTREGRAQNRRVDLIVSPNVEDSAPQIRQAQ